MGARHNRECSGPRVAKRKDKAAYSTERSARQKPHAARRAQLLRDVFVDCAVRCLDAEDNVPRQARQRTGCGPVDFERFDVHRFHPAAGQRRLKRPRYENTEVELPVAFGAIAHSELEELRMGQVRRAVRWLELQFERVVQGWVHGEPVVL